MSRPRPADVRFYIDQDLRGAGKVLGGLRVDVTYPGDIGAIIKHRERPACPVREGALDVEWLPAVGARGWLAITRDRRIQMSISELTAVRDKAVRMVCLTGQSGHDKWHQLECLLTHWDKLEQTLDEPGPFVYKLSKASGLRALDIDDALRRLRSGRSRA